MPIDPADAVADAVAAYFATEIADLKAIRGWPERGDDLDLDGADGTGGGFRAALSVAMSPNYTAEWHVPVEATRTDNGATIEVFYRCAILTIRGQIDLWAPHRAIRDEFGFAVTQKGASNLLPNNSGLRLISAGYYNRPINVTVMGGRNEDDDDSVSRGEWRKTWSLVAVTDLVLPKDHPKLVELNLALTTTLGGIDSTESVTLTP